MLDKAPNKRVADFLEVFGAALSAGDIETAVGQFQDDCYWRDLVAFTWNIRTMEGKDQVRDMLQQQLALTKPSNWAIAKGEDAAEANGIVEAWITFETDVARGFGHIRLKDGRVWTLLTTMTELKGYEEPLGFARPLGVPGALTSAGEELEGRARAGDRRARPFAPALLPDHRRRAGRHRPCGAPEAARRADDHRREERAAGDSWRKRYKSLCLHDPVWYDHMPYLPFPKNWPVFSPKDKIGDWLEMYTKVMELNYWGSTECKSASFDDKRKEWTVVVRRDGKDVVLKPKQLVLATGMASKPIIPNLPGSRRHSRASSTIRRRHPGPDAYAGKRAVVIGSNTSAHDICAALWEAGADVTMVQRSSTNVIRSEPLTEIATGPLYSEDAAGRGSRLKRPTCSSPPCPTG